VDSGDASDQPVHIEGMASLEYFVLFPVAGAVDKIIRREYRWGRDGQTFEGFAHLLQATAHPIHEGLHSVRECAFADIGISAILSCPYGFVALLNVGNARCRMSLAPWIREQPKAFVKSANVVQCSRLLVSDIEYGISVRNRSEKESDHKLVPRPSSKVTVSPPGKSLNFLRELANILSMVELELLQRLLMCGRQIGRSKSCQQRPPYFVIRHAGYVVYLGQNASSRSI